MLFEYDPEKSAANKAKHGLDFVDAQALWEDASLVEVDARLGAEARLLAIGRIGLKHWTAVYVRRTGVVRLISVRRARPKEIEHYERGGVRPPI